MTSPWLAIAVYVTGDGGRAVVFFDNIKAVGQTGLTFGLRFGPDLGPRLSPATPASRYASIKATAPRTFAIAWVTYSKSNFRGLCCPNGPRVTWTYAWNGHRIVASGRQPPAGYEFF